MPKIKDLGIKVIPETMRPPEIGGGGGGGCTDCTMQAFSICGGTHGGGGCTDCTFQAFSICGGTMHGCTDCTIQAGSICGGTIACTAPHSLCGCTWRPHTLIGCWRSIGCIGQTGCGNTAPPCAAMSALDPTIFQLTIQQQAGGITREQIAALKEQLQKQIAALDEHAKTLGPKTADEIDAREKQLTEELAELQTRRKNLK